MLPASLAAIEAAYTECNGGGSLNNHILNNLNMSEALMTICLNIYLLIFQEQHISGG